MKPKKLKKLLKAVKSVALVSGVYDMLTDKKPDSTSLSIGHWIQDGSGFSHFVPTLKLQLKDFRKLSRAYVKLQRKLKKHGKVF